MHTRRKLNQTERAKRRHFGSKNFQKDPKVNEKQTSLWVNALSNGLINGPINNNNDDDDDNEDDDDDDAR